MITLNRVQLPLQNPHFVLQPVHQLLALRLVTLVCQQLLVLGLYLIEYRDVLLDRCPQVI